MNSKPYAVFVRVFLAAAAMTGFALGARSALAHPPMGGGPPEMSSMLESRIGRLDLDDQTRNAVYAIIDGAKSTERDTQNQLRREHETLRTLLEKDAPDEGAVLAEADRIGSLTTELRKQELRTLLAVRAQLTPEQRAQLRPPHGFHHECSGSSGSKPEH